MNIKLVKKQIQLLLLVSFLSASYPVAAAIIMPSPPQYLFTNITTYAAGVGPDSIAMADFDGDGMQDLAVANRLSDNVTVLLGDGLGRFAAGVNYPTGVSPYSVKSADFNGDGIQDLVTASYGANSVTLLLGNGLGGFAAGVSFPVGTTPDSVTIDDFNRDGREDLAVANTGSSNISLLFGDGLGGFAVAVNYFVGGVPIAITSSDYNGDGERDLAAAANFASDMVSIFLGDGLGGFRSAVNYPTGTASASVMSSDFNSDGKQDLAVVNRGSNNISILLGDGLGGFAATVNYPTSVGSISVTTADFNRDGKLDLAMANLLSKSFTVLLGDGLGGFAARVDQPTGATSYSIINADFNNDGKQDLAMANEATNTVSILFGDNNAPVGTMVIDTGNKFALSSTVNLTLSCSDNIGCKQMQFSNDLVSWAPPIANASSAGWTLAAGADGVRTVYCRFIDPAGNISNIVSDTIILDTLAPSAPVIIAPANDVATIARIRPIIGGTAEVNALVTVRDGASVLGLITATNGRWRLASGAATLKVATHSFTATATDRAGNESPASSVVRYTVTVPPPSLLPASGGGCTIGREGSFDSTLLALMLLSFALWVGKRDNPS